ncbi:MULTISPECIES: hypothetical protein [Streptococcus]|uniref:hypothetical protein n=1 Tax=Streptococcus TaxID=1301 RepID=UPI0010C538F3|nr:MULTISPECIES: hypothetical protein [Streptococcus]MBF0775998.1 hypothetical protein [Streptococcus sp. 19428wD3_AN2]MBF0787989.1 hypothetical protein [Streptococcus sp. 19428wC2_LYSM12]QBX22505.1 hypothetical protein Javan85_0008 [Streptococcus phage Javan85]QBX31928.1 hypothetical protein Javan84_0051 [Streptococcus phage Javan84]
MGKNNIELTAEIISSLHDELHKEYFRQADFNKPFGQYVAEQFEHIYDGINNAVSKRYG